MSANIYLVGFMGTGKSAVGRELASRLRRRFVDLDSLIEQRQDRKIAQIFAEEGEGYFRNLEKQALLEISKAGGLVASCGGGIVLDRENIKIMKQSGVMICLSCRPEVILDRTRGIKERPLLNVDNPAERIRELLKLRAPFYAEADYTIDTSDLPVSSLAGRLLEYVRARQAGLA